MRPAGGGAHLGAELGDAAKYLSHVAPLEHVNGLEETRSRHSVILAESEEHGDVLHLSAQKYNVS